MDDEDLVPEQGVNEGVQDSAEEVAQNAEVGEPEEGDGRDPAAQEESG